LRTGWLDGIKLERFSGWQPFESDRVLDKVEA